MGEVFAGRYELADPIGRGGVGAVWRAWDHRRRRYVAAKVLLQSDAHSLLRFVREQALRIDHPHVLAPASWAADDDKVLFTMDLVAGGSLVHLVGDYGPLPPVFVCTLLDQLLAGLAAVHAEGVVHRDIKPANILLEATGTARPRLRLSDFGIAMRLGEPRLTETNLVVGTPGYLAPEQMMGAEPDFPADLFAVGLVALYLLEGAKPDAKALIQYFAAHGTPGAPQSVPEPLWQVVASLLQPDPQARFRTATGARKALAAARELLPEPGPDDESIEIFDQLGPVPPGFGLEGPLKRAPGVDPNRTRNGMSGAGEIRASGPVTEAGGLLGAEEARGLLPSAEETGRLTGVGPVLDRVPVSAPVLLLDPALASGREPARAPVLGPVRPVRRTGRLPGRARAPARRLAPVRSMGAAERPPGSARETGWALRWAPSPEKRTEPPTGPAKAMGRHPPSPEKRAGPRTGPAKATGGPPSPECQVGRPLGTAKKVEYLPALARQATRPTSEAGRRALLICTARRTTLCTGPVRRTGLFPGPVRTASRTGSAKVAPHPGPATATKRPDPAREANPPARRKKRHALAQRRQPRCPAFPGGQSRISARRRKHAALAR